ncbi:methionyl-tRNA formyltransferase [Nitrosomonas aestuarii]|uniref:Methionyl-tRNA formyltransferase n=1 Tax=Nitrosomonas aestuarii TaxID=52441 RepID=A0A1I4CKN8_9PROT|nr:methionyl-tRNA formyltransferase [Nitrosomonas aestuarii]SFK81190.1 methionyl-tRNA formyltransferase [Nitrosomonas aestuarii]
MKIIFAGTPVFAATALDALLETKHEIALVLTQPDRPAGRGMKMVASAVKQSADMHGLSLLQPQSLKEHALHTQLSAINADVMIVAAYGLILPEAVLKIPRYGCLNIHASILPRWRGAAPIQRAILAGDKDTGITIMQMDTGLDTGAMLLKENLDISQDDTTQTLHDKLCRLGAHTIIKALSLYEQQKLTPVQQDESQACYAAKIKKTEAQINWQQSAEEIERKVRAFNPAPGAYSLFRGNKIKIWQAKVIPEISGRCGTIMATERDGITVACGADSLLLEIIQKPGGKRLTATEFLAGFNMHTGDYFDVIDKTLET